MTIPEKLKINKFREVLVPRMRDIFARFGYLASPATQYSGDNPVIIDENKVQNIARTYAELNEKKI